MDIPLRIPVGAVAGLKIQEATHPCGFDGVGSTRISWITGRSDVSFIVIRVENPAISELAMIVQTTDGLGFLFGGTQGRQKEACKDGNDGNDHQ